ncbi:MAG: cell wall hydrolase, partial [archaeon]
MKNTKKTNTFLYLFFLFIIFNSFLVNASQEDIINLKYEFEPLNVNTLKRGDFGIDVAMLQAKLHYLNLYNDKIDGAFGLKTKNAVELFQKQNNLMITGIADKNTILKLNDLKLRVDLNYSLNDLMHLASLIYAEARGESYEGKIAVGAVVLNRVKSSLYPNTIKDVIMQNKQFSVVCDG